jgi:hypothetical protein
MGYQWIRAGQGGLPSRVQSLTHEGTDCQRRISSAQARAVP